jgi:hypothetical protein
MYIPEIQLIFKLLLTVNSRFRRGFYGNCLWEEMAIVP